MWRERFVKLCRDIGNINDVLINGPLGECLECYERVNDNTWSSCGENDLTETEMLADLMVWFMKKDKDPDSLKIVVIFCER